jgi:hypothetical protein
VTELKKYKSQLREPDDLISTLQAEVTGLKKSSVERVKAAKKETWEAMKSMIDRQINSKR